MRRLARRVGLGQRDASLADRFNSRALGRVALTGARFSAIEPLLIGLVHEICCASELEAAAPKASSMISWWRLARIRAATALIAEAIDTPDAPALPERIVNEAASRRLPEAAEGLASFAGKRRPSWCPPA